MPKKKNLFHKYVSTVPPLEDSEIAEDIDPDSSSTDPPSHPPDEEDFTENSPQQNNDYPSALKEAGYTDSTFIATATQEEIHSISGIGISQAKTIIAQAQEASGFEFQTAASLLKTQSNATRISTGSKKFNDILGGGIESNCITEFYGAFTTGKTQVCTQLAVNVVLPKEKGGLGGDVIYIDTEGSFRPERVVQICDGLEIDPEPILARIFVGRAHNSDIQMQLTAQILQVAKNKDIRLVIIDSMTSTFRAEYVGKDALIARQQKLNQHMRQLSRIADLLNTSVVITNQVMAVVNGFENTVMPIGGNILGHGSTHRLHFSKSHKYPSIRYVKLVASPSLPDAETMFEIKQEGIWDVDVLDLGDQ